jgi:hypothetical protein
MEVYFKNLTPEEGTADRLLCDLNALDQNTQELFLVSEGLIAEKSKEKFIRGLERVKATCRTLQEQSNSSEEVPGDVRPFPFVTMGIVFSLGLLLGTTVKRC